MKALDKQIGGSHYQGFSIPPSQFIMENELNFLQGCVIKRICRYNVPGGKGLEDLRKAQHEIDMLIELQGLDTNAS